jgi:signal transduction histidine kinase
MRLALDPSLGKVPLDSKRFRRAISELIENSLTYIDSGEMTVRTSRVDRSATDVTRNSKTMSFAQIVVEDSGPGVDSEQKSVIFQPFYSGRAKGMGLGLSIVKGIVEAHGGYVFEAGEQGLGARFVILMPI